MNAFLRSGWVAVCGGAFLALAPAAWAAEVTLLRPPRTFPLTIAVSGSYRLKGNFTVPDANTTAILITADNVTLDLNGYTVGGPVSCSGGPPVSVCAPSGTGRGIDGSAHDHLTVFNGTVRGMGDDGIVLGTHSIVQRVLVTNNGGDGITAGRVADSIADNNGAHGIDALHIRDCIAEGNRTRGLAAFVVVGAVAMANGGTDPGIVGSVVTASAASDNASAGIAGGAVTGSTALNNGGNGVSGSTVLSSWSSSNGGMGIVSGVTLGSVADSSGGDGITGSTVANSAASGSTGLGISALNAAGNAAWGNTGYGLSSFGGYDGNVIISNTAGTVTGFGLDLGHNNCNGSLTCP